MATLEEPSVDTFIFGAHFAMRHVRNSRVIQKLRVVLQDESLAAAQQGLLWFQGVIILVRRQKKVCMVKITLSFSVPLH